MKINFLFVACALLMTGCKKHAPANANPSNTKTETISDSTLTAEKSTDSKVTEIREERFDFITELCENKGYFDSTKYSREEIEGTYKLWFNSGAFAINTPSVFRPDDLYKMRRENDLILAKLDSDFSERKKVLEKLIVVKTPYWQNIKKAHLEELKQSYEKNKLQITAYINPKVLINNSFTKNCQNFAKALNGSNEEIMSEWRTLTEAMSKRNGNPQRIMDEFESNSQFSDWKDFAIINLITFGWGNCATQYIQRPKHDEKMSQEFNALFIKIDSECIEP